MSGSPGGRGNLMYPNLGGVSPNLFKVLHEKVQSWGGGLNFSSGSGGGRGGHGPPDPVKITRHKDGC